MMTPVITLVLQAWAIAAALQLVLWLIQLRTGNAGIVDVGWAGSFAIVIGWFALRADVAPTSWLPIAAVVGLWSVRLTGYLIARGAATGPEEGRYRDLRARWSPHAARSFFIFFQAQAALVGVLSIAFVVPFVALPDRPWFSVAGVAISTIGIIGEATADYQLARWRRDPAHRGKVCDVGLWGYSRHPNYFFEWCVWIGYAVVGFGYWPWGVLAVIPQAVILASIFGVTGIPSTENQAIRSKGDAYRDYQKRVSRFVPLPPKSRGHEA